MKKSSILVIIFFLLLLVASCGTKSTEPEPTSQQDTVQQEQIQQGLLSSTYTYEDENITMKIVVNKIDKSGTVDVNYYVPDSEESYYAMDKGTYSADQASENGSLFTLLFCNVYWGIFRDIDNANNFSDELQEENPNTISLTDQKTQEEGVM